MPTPVQLVDVNNVPYTAGGAVAAADGAIVTIGSEADAAWSGTGNATVIAALKALHNDNLSVPTNLPPSDTTDQARIGSITETAPTTDTGASGLNGRLQRLAQTLTTLVARIGSAGVPLQQAGTSNSLVVGGAVADGIAPTSNSVYVAGLDTGGLKRSLSTDTVGRLTPGAAANWPTAQISVGTTATLIFAARTTRQSVTVTNSGTTPVYLGGSGVTVTTGVLLPGVLGASITIRTTAAIYGIAASAQTVTGYELY